MADRRTMGAAAAVRCLAALGALAEVARPREEEAARMRGEARGALEAVVAETPRDGPGPVVLGPGDAPVHGDAFLVYGLLGNANGEPWCEAYVVDDGMGGLGRSGTRVTPGDAAVIVAAHQPGALRLAIRHRRAGDPPAMLGVDGNTPLGEAFAPVLRITRDLGEVEAVLGNLTSLARKESAQERSVEAELDSEPALASALVAHDFDPEAPAPGPGHPLTVAIAAANPLNAISCCVAYAGTAWTALLPALRAHPGIAGMTDDRVAVAPGDID